MSLLIKALQKAEEQKKPFAQAESEPVRETSPLSLEPLNENDALSLAQEAGLTSSSARDETEAWKADTSGQAAAATVFLSKTPTTGRSGSKKTVWLGMLLGCLLILAGGFYYYLNQLEQPQLIRAPRVVHIESPEPATLSTPTPENPANETVQEPTTGDQASSATMPTNSEDGAGSPEQHPNGGEPNPPAMQNKPASDLAIQRTVPVNQTISVKATANSVGEDGEKATAENAQGEKDTPTDQTYSNATDKKPEKLVVASPRARPSTSPSKRMAKSYEDGMPGVSRGRVQESLPAQLNQAYEAFSAGDNEKAQPLYRAVLRNDPRNVDALLGMAAIATRQGRKNDAMGWFGKVLEVDPKNPLAQAASAELLSQVDPVNAESRLKSLIAQQPQSAALHAALGHVYAEQGQWALAQQAYFDAHHYDPSNPDYTFDLAVSLDQLGKSTLALPYYREALAKWPANTTSIDRKSIEARIQALSAQGLTP